MFDWEEENVKERERENCEEKEGENGEENGNEFEVNWSESFGKAAIFSFFLASERILFSWEEKKGESWVLGSWFWR